MFTPIENRQPCRVRYAQTFLFQNPESARTKISPLAPAAAHPADQLMAETQRSALGVGLPRTLAHMQTSAVSARLAING